MMRGGFPDIQWTLEEIVAEGDKVAARFTMRGTHRGTFFGVPPTGKTISVQAMNTLLSVGRAIRRRTRRAGYAGAVEQWAPCQQRTRGIVIRLPVTLLVNRFHLSSFIRPPCTLILETALSISWIGPARRSPEHDRS